MIENTAAKLQTTSNDMDSTILEIGRTSIREYLFQYLAAATVSKTEMKETIVAWYSGQPLHTAALSLDLVHNALIKSMLGNDYGIRVTNQPLSYKPDDKKTDYIYHDNFGETFAYVIGIMMAVYSASYVTFLIKVINS